MAHRLAGPCRTARCSSLASAGSGFCSKCRSAAFAQDRARRGSAHERGYDADWQRFREWFLRQRGNVVCADCQREASSEVHHVAKLRDCPARRLDPANCIGLCRDCHQIRTRRGE